MTSGAGEPDSVALPTRRATRTFARALAAKLSAGDAVVLSGPLGAGKTFLVRAVCRALGLPREARVVSPTFTLVHELPTSPPLAHADLYRLTSDEAAFDLGLLELRERGYVLMVEWGERFLSALGADCLVVSIEREPRRVSFSANGPRSEQLKAELSALMLDSTCAVSRTSARHRGAKEPRV